MKEGVDGDVSPENDRFDLDSYQLPIFEPLKVLMDVKSNKASKNMNTGWAWHGEWFHRQRWEMAGGRQRQNSCMQTLNYSNLTTESASAKISGRIWMCMNYSLLLQLIGEVIDFTFYWGTYDVSIDFGITSIHPICVICILRLYHVNFTPSKAKLTSHYFVGSAFKPTLIKTQTYCQTFAITFR